MMFRIKAFLVCLDGWTIASRI